MVRAKQVNELQPNIATDKWSQPKLKNNRIHMCIQFKFPSILGGIFIRAENLHMISPLFSYN